MKLIWIFIAMGGFLGGFIPMLFGASYTSLWGILTGAVGSVVGIWIYKKLDLE